MSSSGEDFRWETPLSQRDMAVIIAKNITDHVFMYQPKADGWRCVADFGYHETGFVRSVEELLRKDHGFETKFWGGWLEVRTPLKLTKSAAKR
jgi:hypothetical protein